MRKFLNALRPIAFLVLIIPAVALAIPLYPFGINTIEIVFWIGIPE